MNLQTKEKDKYVNLIRETHRNLRRKLTDGNDFVDVWKQHCSDDRLLQDYSSAMKELATTVWDTDCDGRDRTKWCSEVSLEYYRGDGLSKLLRKDERRKVHYEKEKIHFLCSETNNGKDAKNQKAPAKPTVRQASESIKLLDVGSCFNPFGSLPEFQTTAIDLSPANQDVYKCDFLSVPIDHESTLKHIESCSDIASNSLSTLPSEHFDVVVFSLLLSYIPCPHSRWLMCEKAHQVLSSNGLLLIITPDSSHQNRHAALMKKWKIAIEQIGFQRIKYEKDKHFHFLAFRKLPADFIWDKRKQKSAEPEKILNIPQDFTDKKATIKIS